MHTARHLDLVHSLSPILIAGLWIALCSLLREPVRRQFSAILVAGAGAAYLSGGFGLFEVAFCALMTLIAFRGLANYKFIAFGWLLHTAWDISHHLYGNPILPFAPTSSAGCAICDSVVALWYFLGAPSIYPQSRSKPIATAHAGRP